MIAFAVIAGIIIWRVVSLRRNPEPKKPQNLEPFLNDEEMEGRKLERVLGLALIAVLVMAVSIPLYFLVEPSRESSAQDDFDDRAVERGAVLFANDQSPHYDPTRSLLCANCHGVDGKGGSAPFVIRSEDPSCDLTKDITDDTPSECLPTQVHVAGAAARRRAAALRQEAGARHHHLRPARHADAGLGREERQGRAERAGRQRPRRLPREHPGHARAGEEALQRRHHPGEVRQGRDATLARRSADAQQALADATTAAAADGPGGRRRRAGGLDAQITYNEHVQQASDGELVFESQCARCHTKGWSYYDPLNPDANPAPGPQGGGAYGPNLTDGSELRQFPGEAGPTNQYDWVANGKPANESYGVRGISSGRMPHYINILSKDEIEAVVDYERGL